VSCARSTGMSCLTSASRGHTAKLLEVFADHRGMDLSELKTWLRKPPAEIVRSNSELIRQLLCMKPVSETAAESMFAAVKVRDTASRWFWKCSCCAGHSAFFQLYSGGVMRLCSSCRRLWLRRQPGKVYDGIAVDSTRFEIFKGRMDFFHSSFGGFSVHAGLAVLFGSAKEHLSPLRGAWSSMLALAVRINLALEAKGHPQSSTLYHVCVLGWRPTW